MWDNFSSELKTYILKLGYSKKEARSLSYDTKFYHDLGYKGDTAEECMEKLQNMGVDMEGFIFRDFFPPEFHESFILNLLPIPEKLLIKKEKYKPLTLAMLEGVLETKIWVD